ncbi:hypothetical protein [Algiphilus sp.]|uniref:hypothetical protein n=1 Tax=Algiphilus sp. TaxID=1872431 RepID=UPI0032ED089E
MARQKTPKSPHTRMPLAVWRAPQMRDLHPRHRVLLWTVTSWHDGDNNGCICLGRTRIMRALGSRSHRAADEAYLALIRAGVIVQTKPPTENSERWIALTWLAPGRLVGLQHRIQRTDWGWPGGRPAAKPYLMLPLPAASVRRDWEALPWRARALMLEVIADHDGGNNGQIAMGRSAIRRHLGCGPRDASAAMRALISGGWLIETAPAVGRACARYALPWHPIGRRVDTGDPRLLEDRLDMLPATHDPVRVQHREPAPGGGAPMALR